MTADDNNNNNNNPGPSKGELKKLAKKAEKAAKKAAAATSGGATAAASGAPSKASVSATAGSQQQLPPPPPPLVWTLQNPNASHSSTVTAVWAAEAFGVSLTAVSNPSHPTTTALTYGNHHSRMTDPTSMVTALATAGGNRHQQQQQDFLQSIDVDEVCEWLRRPMGQTRDDVVHVLEAKLTASATTPSHVVGPSLTVADIMLHAKLVSLVGPHTGGGVETTEAADPTAAVDPLPRACRLFYEAHRVAYAKAVTQAQVLQEHAASSSSSYVVDMDEPSLQTVVDAVFRSLVKDTLGDDIPLPPTIVKPCQNTKHGDFQFSAAMPIFAALKKAGQTEYASPVAVAQALVAAVGPDHPVLRDVATQGPGFVLCRLAPQYLQHHVNVFLRTNQLAMPRRRPSPASAESSSSSTKTTTTTDPPSSMTCVVDFSSPNIAKEMHVGHLRSTIIGESVCRILEAAGHSVHRVNHVGDWGTQFGMLIQYLKEEYPDICVNTEEDSAADASSALPNITDLTVFYKNAKQRFDDDADFKKTAQTNVVKLQSGDPECRKIWHMLCDVSRREFQKVYHRLDVTCEEFGESYYNDKIAPVIQEFEAANKIKVEEGGAKCVFVDKFKVPLMLQKSDGGYGYDSTDMAALKYRLFELKADRVICITDFSQGDHFKMIFQAGRDIGWLSEKNQLLQHIGFGTVQGEDGKRFKTRSGDTVRLVDLLDEAVQRMETELRQRLADGKANIAEEDVHAVAEAIGYGAVKYYDLRRNPTSNYKFSYDQMLDTKGDTAVYLLYARVRLESIVARAQAEFGVDLPALLKDGATAEIVHASERNLALQLTLFCDTMEQTLEDLYPCHICEYVYKLATVASDFVTQCRVLGSPEMQSRVLLCHATASAMRQCFDLLGIRHVKRI